MKRCPTCQSTYTDDSLSFCLTDGAALVDGAPLNLQATLPNEFQSTLRDENRTTMRDDNQPTLQYPSPRSTDQPPTAIPKADMQPQGWSPNPAWTPVVAPPVSSRRNTKPWIIGAFIVVLAGIIITVIAIISSRSSSNESLKPANRSSSDSSIVANVNSDRPPPQNENTNQNANKPVTETDAPPTDPDLVLSQLTALEYEWNDANMKGNKAAIRRIVADEFRGVGANGAVENKEQMIAHTVPTPEIASLTLSDLKASLAGNTVVLTGLNTAKGKNGQVLKFRFTDTFLWRDGRWQAISSQASQVK